jgi:hypothetical protein
VGGGGIGLGWMWEVGEVGGGGRRGYRIGLDVGVGLGGGSLLGAGGGSI